MKNHFAVKRILPAHKNKIAQWCSWSQQLFLCKKIFWHNFCPHKKLSKLRTKLQSLVTSVTSNGFTNYGQTAVGCERSITALINLNSTTAKWREILQMFCILIINNENFNGNKLRKNKRQLSDNIKQKIIHEKTSKLRLRKRDGQTVQISSEKRKTMQYTIRSREL